MEETGICGAAQRVFTAVDAFDRDDSGYLHQHFVLIAVLCKWISGDPIAADDALEARWFRIEDLAATGLALSLDVAEVAQQAARISEDLFA